MEKYAEAFYKSRTWRKCRASYLASVCGLCERCLRAGRITPAEVVHHRIYISPENINKPEITLNFANLEALCWACHEQEHKGRQKRYMVDAEGHVIGRE